MTFISYAQNFEDVMLWRALKHVERGFYVDVGAAHPDDYSVTRAFYDRGWQGINIEPTNRFTRLAGARARDINIHAAVGRKESELKLFVIEDNKDISTIDPEVAAMHRAAGWTIAELRVPTVTLAGVFREHVKGTTHFLKIDVEGTERDVLLSADLEHFRPWIVVIEATAPNSEVQTHSAWEELLIAANYRFCWFDGLNRFYIAAEQWDGLSPAFNFPPNIFDDFIRATDTEHLNKIIGAEAAYAEATGRAGREEMRARLAEASAMEAIGRASAAETRASQAETRATQAEAQAAQAEARAVQAEASAAQAELQATQAAKRTEHVQAHSISLESRLAEVAAQLGSALAEIAALRASNSWRLTAPLRALSKLSRRH